MTSAETKPAKRGAKKKPIMGHTKPRIHTPYLKGESKIAELVDLAEKIGMPLLPWQHHVLEDMLRVDADGNWRRKLVGILVARQSGKTHLARMMILGHLFLWDSKNVIAMSSNRNMALDTFRQVAYTIETNEFLKCQLKKIRYANGQEVIELLNGARYEIVAATVDGPRGKTADFLYIDELREVTEEAWTAARPTTRARPNAVTLTTSNAGDGVRSTVLNDLRERALSYPSPTFGWYEYSAPSYCKIDDQNAWAMANPALGYTVSLESLAEAVATNSVEATRTELLCQWVDAMGSPWPPGVIEATSNSDLILPQGRPTVFALDVSPSRRSGALCAGQLMDDGTIGVGLMQLWTSEVAIDEIKMAAEINEWAKKFRPQVILYDKYATASIAQRLEQSSQKIEDVSGQKFYQACGELLDGFVNSRIVHSGQPELVQQFNNCAAKTNDSGWRIIRRKSAGDVTGAICVAMLVHKLNQPVSTPKIFSV